MGGLEFRQDFETVREVWRQFWNGTLQRPILLSSPPRAGVEPIQKPPWGAAFSLPCEEVVEQALRWGETHDFLGDTVPFFTPSLIIDLMPAFLGAEITSITESWGTDTHAIPFIRDLNSATIRFRRDSIWWEKWMRLAECIKRRCTGRLIFGSAAPCYNNLDTLAAIRGNVELMTDFYDNPDGVHRAMQQIMAAFAEVTEEVCRILEIETRGSVTGHGFYSDGRAATPQCDFGFNIGKEHFDEFALPYLRQELELFDAVEYHLDGPGNITHAESICGIDKVKVVQWVPGVGNAQKQDWTGLFAKIADLGKGLWLHADSPKTAVALWEKYNASGRMILNVRAENADAMNRYLDAFGNPKRTHRRKRDTHPDSACSGKLADLSKAEFRARYVPQVTPTVQLRALDFLPGRTSSEAIEAAIATARESGTSAALLLDARDWVIDRAILLPSNVELIIDGCTLRLADGVFDNIIRVAGIRPNPTDPNGVCSAVEPTENIRITGRNHAVIEGAGKPYTAANPKTGVVEQWVGDFFGWRTVGILLALTTRYEISGFTMRKTHCWAISQEQCSRGFLHDIVFDTHVKNGDGINFRNGCSLCYVDSISGTTSDDMVACTALNGSYITPESKYIYPMQPMGLTSTGNSADIHDIVIRNIRKRGQHHAVICLATSPSVYNITIEDVLEEETAAMRLALVRIYTGYGSGYRKGNLRNISVTNVVARGARFAVLVKAAVKDVWLSDIRNLGEDGQTHLFGGESENLSIAADVESEMEV